MPRKPSGLFNQAEYVKQYQRANVIGKKITFNRTNPEDMELMSWLESRPEGMVAYMKRLIREDMESKKARDSYNFEVAKAWSSLSGITVPLVDGYRDEAAIKTATNEGHRIFVRNYECWEIRIDADDKKVLTVRRR